MPYITQEQRKNLDPDILSLSEKITEKGELNYCIFKLMNLLVQRDGISYKNLASVSSEVHLAELEFYRRVTAPYEDIKIKQNGDII